MPQHLHFLVPRAASVSHVPRWSNHSYKPNWLRLRSNMLQHCSRVLVYDQRICEHSWRKNTFCAKREPPWIPARSKTCCTTCLLCCPVATGCSHSIPKNMKVNCCSTRTITWPSKVPTAFGSHGCRFLSKAPRAVEGATVLGRAAPSPAGILHLWVRCFARKESAACCRFLHELLHKDLL